MKKSLSLIAAAGLLATQAFAQTPPGPTDGSNKAPALPSASAARPAGGGGEAAPMGAADSKGAGKAARSAKREQMKKANRSGDIPSPTVAPKSY